MNPTTNAKAWQRRILCLIWLVPDIVVGCLVGLTVGVVAALLAAVETWQEEKAQ